MASTSYPITALYLGKSLNLAEIEKKNDLALLARRRNSLLFQPTSDRMAIVSPMGWSCSSISTPNCPTSTSNRSPSTARTSWTPEDRGLHHRRRPGSEDVGRVQQRHPEQDRPRQDPHHRRGAGQSVAIEYVEERAIQFVANLRDPHRSGEDRPHQHQRQGGSQDDRRRPQRRPIRHHRSSPCSTSPTRPGRTRR